MKRAKTFDCVELKNRIQARLRHERQGLNDAEERAAVRRKLEASTSPVGRLWQALMRREAGR